MNTHQNLIGIIGASGKTGGRVKLKLNELGYNVKGLSRQTTPSFDWDQPEQWQASLEGLTSLYITYQPDLAIPRAAEDIKTLISAAKAAGVQHLVLLSGRGEEGAENAEQQVINSGLEWNIVRASWFMQNFSESFMLDGVLAREMVLPHAKADEPFIDVDDIADVVTAAMIKPELRNQLFEITGPELLSFEYCVATIATAIGKKINYQPIHVDDYIASAKQHGMPDDIAWLMNELFTNVLDGSNAFTTNTITNVLGREPKRFEDYVAEIASTDVWKNNSASATAA